VKINGINVDIENNREIDDSNLEQAIFGAWHTADDLKLLLQSLEFMDKDQVFAAIHGLQIFADARCQKLMDVYEQILDNRRVRNCEQGEQTASFGQEKI